MFTEALTRVRTPAVQIQFVKSAPVCIDLAVAQRQMISIQRKTERFTIVSNHEPLPVLRVPPSC